MIFSFAHRWLALLSRLFLILIGAIIVLIYDGLVSWNIFLIVAIIYIILCIVAFFYWGLGIKYLPLFIILADFLFINLVVWGREAKLPLIYFFIVLPLISYLPVIFNITFPDLGDHFLKMTIFLIITYGIHMRPMEDWMIISMIVLGLYGFSSIIRWREWGVVNKVSKDIDYFIINQNDDMTLIYSSIARELNAYFRFSKGSGISNIRVYSKESHNQNGKEFDAKNYFFWLNSSEFTWERKLTIDEKKLEKLERHRVLYENNGPFYFYIKQRDIAFVFVCDIERKFSYRLKYVISISLLNRVFSQVALLHYYDIHNDEIINRKDNETRDWVMKLERFSSFAHHIRNQLSPIKSIITYHTYIKDNPNKRTDEKLLNYVESELVPNAQNTFNEIVKTTEVLFEDYRGLLKITRTLDEISVIEVFNILSKYVQRYLNREVYVDDLFKKHKESNFIVKINKMQLNLLFSNWTENIRKYNNGFYSASMEFIINDDLIALIVHFENNFIEQNENIPHIIEFLNNKDINYEDAIYHKGLGLSSIKSIAKDYEIGLNASIDNNLSYGKIIKLNFCFTVYEK